MQRETSDDSGPLLARVVAQARETLRGLDDSGPVLADEQYNQFKSLTQEREQREATLRGIQERLRRKGWHSFEDIAQRYGLGPESRIYSRILEMLRSDGFLRDGRPATLILQADPRAGRKVHRATRLMAVHRVGLFGDHIEERHPRRSPIVVNFLRHGWIPDEIYKRLKNDLMAMNEKAGNTSKRRPGKPKGAGEIDDTKAIARIVKLEERGMSRPKAIKIVQSELGMRTAKELDASRKRWSRKLGKLGHYFRWD